MRRERRAVPEETEHAAPEAGGGRQPARRTLLDTLARATGILIGATDSTAAVSTALAVVGEGMGVDRVSVFENATGDGEPLTTQIFEWCRPGVEPQIDNPLLNRLPYREIPHVARALRDGRSFGARVSDLAEPERSLMEARSIRSLLLVPIRVDDAWWGFIELDDCTAARGWSETEEVVLTAVAGMVGAEIRKIRSVEALQKSEEQFRLLVASVQDYAIFLLDENGRVASWNAGAERIKGYRAEEIIGQPYAIFYDPADRAAGLPDRALETARRERVYRAEGWRVRKDGSRFWADAVITALTDAEGRLRGYAKVTRDVTERMRAAEQLQRAKEDLERRVEERTAELERRAEELVRSNRELEQFAYVASHDLKEPLRMVANYTQMLQRFYGERLDEEGKRMIEYAVEGAQRMHGLIEALLTLSRVGWREEAVEPVDVGELVEQVHAVLRVTMEEAGAQLTWGALPVVSAEPGRLHQLFQNLIGNAIKFRHPSRPSRVRVDARRRGRDWLFSVADNGIGIEPQYYDRIFEIFQRLHTREEYEGTGIGLAICKKIVEHHGGKIWIESVPGEGSTFFFTLPA